MPSLSPDPCLQESGLSHTSHPPTSRSWIRSHCPTLPIHLPAFSARRSMWAGQSPLLACAPLSSEPSTAHGTQKAPHQYLGNEGTNGERGCPGNSEGLLPWGLRGAHLGLEARGFCRTHKVGGAPSRDQCEAQSPDSWMSPATGLPIPAPPRPTCVCLGQVTFPLCASVCSSEKWRRWQALSELLGAGSADLPGKARTQSALDKCWGNCCGRGERVKARRFLIVK